VPRGTTAGCAFSLRAHRDVSELVIHSPAPPPFCPVKSITDYAQKIDQLRDSCPVKAAIDVVRGRWKPSILFELKVRAKRFSELQAALTGIAPQALTVQLRQLEADGVIVRTVYPEIPARVEYALSPDGKTLSDVMDALDHWGTAYLARQSQEHARTV
jgi:DNA-binding HxlR family transcriptional regulator